MSLKLSARAALALVVTVMAFLPAQAGGQWMQFNNFTNINSLADAGRHLWMAASGGMIRLDKATGEKSYFNLVNTPFPPTGIHTLVSDGRGRVWAISRSGILREYNGNAWSDLSAQGALNHQAALDLAWDPRGSLWVLAVDSTTREATVFRRKDNRWLRVYLDGTTRFLLSFNASGYYASQANLQVDEQGQAWVAVYGNGPRGLYRIQPDGLSDSVPIPLHLGPEMYIVPRTGRPFWLCRNQIARPAEGGWKTQPLPAGQVFSIGGYGYYRGIPPHPRHFFAQADDGSEYWSFNKPMRLHGDAWEDLTHLGTLPLFLKAETGHGLPQGEVRLWAASRERLAGLTGGTWTFQDVGKKPFGAMVPYYIHPRPRAADEVLMAGGSRLAAFHLASGSLSETMDFAPGFAPGNTIFAIGEDDRERVWIRGATALARIAPDGSKVFTADNSPWKGSSPYVHMQAGGFLATDDQGTVWIVDRDKLISMPGGTEDTRAWSIHSVPGPQGRPAIPLGIARNKDGSLWVAAAMIPEGTSYPGQSFLARYSGKKWTIHDSTRHPWIGTRNIRDFRCDSAGHLWLLASEGMLQWDGKTWKEHTSAHTPQFRKSLTAMALDRTGQPWVATNRPEAFLMKWDGGSWVPIVDLREKFPTAYIANMVFDAAGRLWMTASTDGILVYDPVGTPTKASPGLPRGASGRILSLRRAADGSWRITPGELAGEEALSLRVLDYRGREVPGTGTVLRSSFGKTWIWAGVRPTLAPGNYLVSLQDHKGTTKVVPFRHAP